MIMHGILLTPTGQPMASSAVRLVAVSTSPSVLGSVAALFTTNESGAYSFDCPIGRYRVQATGLQGLRDIGMITITAQTVVDNLNELLMMESTATQSDPIIDKIGQVIAGLAAVDAAVVAASSSANQARTDAEVTAGLLGTKVSVADLANPTDPSKGAGMSYHKEGTVATYLDSLTTGLGDFSAANLLQIHVGDSTVEQAGGSGYMFDFITTYWRGAGMPANGMLGTINFGGSGYRLKNFVEDPLNDAFVGPTGAMPGVTAGPGQWDYYGHKPSGAVSLATALKYRAGVPSSVKHVQWVFCYGINDLILYNDVGAGTVESIANYISGYLVKAMGRIQAAFPGDSMVLRMPNPMVARPYNASFPSATAYPTFDTDLAGAQQLVSNWNAGLRLAYQKAQNIFPRSALFDTGAKVFGSSDPTVSPGQTAYTNPTLQDRVHPSSFGYRQIGHELFNQLFGNQQVRQCYNGRRFMADLKITNGWAGNAWDYYGQYFRNNQKFKELGSFNLVGAGSTYMDVDADPSVLKKILSGFGAGRIFCTVGADDILSTSFLLGNFTSMSIAASGSNSRITGVNASVVAGSRSVVTFYTDNYLSSPKISFAGALVLGQSVFSAIMDVVPSGISSMTITTTLAVSTSVVVQIYRHISNTRTLIATGTIAGNGYNATLLSGTGFTAISAVGILQEVWEILPITATGVPAGCAIKLTLNPN